MNQDRAGQHPNGHYATDPGGGEYQPAGAFDYTAHDRWVLAGHCPVVSAGKAWCSGKAGHGLEHVWPAARPGRSTWER